MIRGALSELTREDLLAYRQWLAKPVVDVATAKADTGGAGRPGALCALTGARRVGQAKRLSAL